MPEFDKDAMPNPRGLRWLWYASKSTEPVPLDPVRYPTIEFDGEPRPRPDWVCQGENGGLHIDARVGWIDVHIVAEPTPRMEINWTKPYGVTIVSAKWLEPIKDLIDGTRIFQGMLWLNGQPLQGWRTLHGLRQPVLRAREATLQSCSKCGNLSSWNQSQSYFDAPEIEERSLIVNSNGIFVRQDLVRERNLLPPTGSYKPTLVGLKRAIRPADDRASPNA